MVKRATSFLISTVLQQCCKTNCTFLLLVLPKVVTTPRQTENKTFTRIHFSMFLRYGQTGNKNVQLVVTCFETLLQNELNSDFVRFPLWIRQNCSATNKVVAGCEQLLQRVAERLKRCSTFCNKICTKFVARSTDPRQTCFATSDVNSVYGVVYCVTPT